MVPKKKNWEPQAAQELGQTHADEPRTTGDQAAQEPMTGAQAAYLKTLCEEVSEPAAFHHRLTRKEASRRIEALREKLRLGALPPHTD